MLYWWYLYRLRLDPHTPILGPHIQRPWQPFLTQVCRDSTSNEHCSSEAKAAVMYIIVASVFSPSLKIPVQPNRDTNQCDWVIARTESQPKRMKSSCSLDHQQINFNHVPNNCLTPVKKVNLWIGVWRQMLCPLSRSAQCCVWRGRSVLEEWCVHIVWPFFRSATCKYYLFSSWMILLCSVSLNVQNVLPLSLCSSSIMMDG